MTSDHIIEFGQSRFGSDGQQPTDVVGRLRVPPWVLSATENAILADGSHAIRVEKQPNDNVLNPVTDTTIPDVLAYYLPFHFYRKSWGIYIRAAGVCALAKRLYPKSAVEEVAALDFSYRLLLEHERLHFFAEYAATRLEVVTSESCYNEYFRDTDAACHEEALANAHSVTVVRRRGPERLAEAAEAWMLTQSVGYRDFKRWLPPRFEQGRRQAAVCMSRAKAMTNILVNRSHPAEFLFFCINQRRSPVRIVLDADLPWLRIAKPFPKQFGLQVHVRSNDHKPPHIHIDRPPGTPYTRYLWPDLTPFPDDARLRSSEEKALRRYVAVHGSAIARKMAAVSWQ